MVPSAFRFLVICREATRNARGEVTLKEIFNDVPERGGFPCHLPMTAVVGLICQPSMQGKRLALIAWWLDRNFERQPVAVDARIPLSLPAETGPQTLPYPIRVPIPAPGIYGFDLIDEDGVCGPKEQSLATFVYSIRPD